MTLGDSREHRRFRGSGPSVTVVAMSAGSTRVELTELERVVPGGTETVRWWVRVGDSWTQAAKHSTAQRERLQAGPGTVWEARVVLELPPGTRLVEVRSLPALKRRSAMQYLEQETRRARLEQHRTLYEVLAGGRLRALPA
jgi:hypothetical protein